MADMEGKESLLENFCTVAGVDEARARFFLELANWNLDLALTNFFETNDESDTEVSARPRDPTPPRGTERFTSGETNPPAASAQGGRSARPTAPPKFGSISTLRHEEKSESSSEEEGQAYYAGGSERTGQQILGPPKKKADPNKLINSLFSAAKEHGAEEAEATVAASSSGPRAAPFQGKAYRLGDPTTESEVIEGRQVNPKRQVEFALKLWKNGFSLNDGPLRDFSDPQNIEFLNSIRQNQLPRELIEQARGGEVGLAMEDHRNEDYAPPKKAVPSFSGVGHRLGSPTDAGQSATGGATSSGSATASAADLASLETSAAQSIHIDANQPTTNLQIRLADGSKLIAKFNHTHRVSDVRRYITSARPQFVNTNFVLMTTFPNREVTNETETLSAANLLNAVLVQKIK